MKVVKTLALTAVATLVLSACNDEKQAETQAPSADNAKTAVKETKKTSSQYEATATLPADVKWETNWDEPKFGDKRAKKGGVIHTSLRSFPQTLRPVGPDSNAGLRNYVLDNVPKLIERHPDTLEMIPGTANEWAFGDDNKTMYFKLNPVLKWSDGTPVTADDFLFTIQFMRSKDITDPWYNDYNTNVITGVEKIDDHTIKATVKEEMNRDDLYSSLGEIIPMPLHWFKEQAKGHDKNNDFVPDDYVRRLNFKVAPTIAPYKITEVDKGKKVVVEKVKDWWGYTNPYYTNRYNVDKEIYNIIRDAGIEHQHFLKGEMDTTGLIIPQWWRERTKLPTTDAYDKGYIYKFWGYNQRPEGANGLWFNTKAKHLDDINVRKGVTYATDIDGMIEHVLFGDYSRLPHGLGTGHGKYDQKTKAPKFDPQLAVEFFEKAGFDKVGDDGIRVNDKGERLSFPINYSWDGHTPRLAYLKEQAKKAGLEFVLELVEGSANFKKTSEKKHVIAWLGMNTGFTPAYWEYLNSENVKPKTNNFTMFSTPRLDELTNEFRVTFDIDKKVAMSHEIRDIVEQNFLIVPSYMVPYSRMGLWRWVKLPEPAMLKLTLSPAGGAYANYGRFWIDEKAREETLKAMKEGKTFEPVEIHDYRYKPE